MNTTTSSKKTTTYTIVPAMFNISKFEVVIKKLSASGVVLNEQFMTTLRGDIREFKSRNGARKAIVRAIRAAAGVPGALHR